MGSPVDFLFLSVSFQMSGSFGTFQDFKAIMGEIVQKSAESSALLKENIPFSMAVADT